MYTTTSAAIQHTQRWLTDAVIRYQLCPFAKQPNEQNAICYHVYTGNEILSLLEQLATCCLALDAHSESELATTLLIIADANYLADFEDYLDVLDVANAFLATPQHFAAHFSADFQTQHGDNLPKTWETAYQIASFHPDYVFENTTPDDRENHTNRSPYPIFHLLRNATLDAVRANDKQAEKIVSRNINTLTQLSAQAFSQLQALAKRE